MRRGEREGVGRKGEGMGFGGSWAGAGRQSCIDSPHPPVRSGLGRGPQLSSRPGPIRTFQPQIGSPVCSVCCVVGK